MRARIQSALLVTTGLLVAAVLLPGAARAQAVADPEFWKQTAEHRDTVYRFIYDQSPQAVPPGYDPVVEAEEILRQRQASLAPSTPSVPSLWQKIRGISWRSGLSAAPRALGVIGLAVGTFETGWKIGTGINAKFLRIGLPDPPEPKVDAANGLLTFQREGYSNPFNETPLPADGWLLRWSAYGQDWTSVNLSSGWSSPCAYLSGPPADFRVLPGVASVGWCVAPPVPVESYWLPENELEAVGPIEDYTDQPYSRESPAPAPPPQTTVEESIGNELDKPDNALLRQWLNYQLGSPLEEDPLGVGPPNAGIEFPDFEEHWSDHEDEFPEYADPWEYWQGAVDIVERGDRSPAGGEGVQRCERTTGGEVDLIYWDIEKATIVVVKDGKIVTYFKPDDADQYWLENCD